VAQKAFCLTGSATSLRIYLGTAAQTKSELVNGRIYAMAGASREHNRIVHALDSAITIADGLLEDWR